MTTQENDEKLLHYESEAVETRKKWEAEKRAADESEAEVLSLQRKIRLLEDRRDKLEERLETTNIQELLLLLPYPVISHFITHFTSNIL